MRNRPSTNTITLAFIPLGDKLTIYVAANGVINCRTYAAVMKNTNTACVLVDTLIAMLAYD